VSRFTLRPLYPCRKYRRSYWPLTGLEVVAKIKVLFPGRNHIPVFQAVAVLTEFFQIKEQ
jgi:hypothetical protein